MTNRPHFAHIQPPLSPVLRHVLRYFQVFFPFPFVRRPFGPLQFLVVERACLELVGNVHQPPPERSKLANGKQ